MLRKYINSEMIFLDAKLLVTATKMEEHSLIIQTERISDTIVLAEIISRDEIFELIPFGNLTTTPTNNKTQQVDEDLIYDYRETIINNDPFGKYSGTKLGEIFDKNDIGWVNNCIKNMKNAYIKDRVNYLAKYYKVV